MHLYLGREMSDVSVRVVTHRQTDRQTTQGRRLYFDVKIRFDRAIIHTKHYVSKMTLKTVVLYSRNGAQGCT